MALHAFVKGSTIHFMHYVQIIAAFFYTSKSLTENGSNHIMKSIHLDKFSAN